jgi:hypothetical protein
LNIRLPVPLTDKVSVRVTDKVSALLTDKESCAVMSGLQQNSSKIISNSILICAFNTLIYPDVPV